MMPDLPQLMIVLMSVLLFVVPPILVLASKRSHGGAKFGWFILAVCFSWLAFAGFLIMTQNNKDNIS